MQDAHAKPSHMANSAFAFASCFLEKLNLDWPNYSISKYQLLVIGFIVIQLEKKKGFIVL